MRRIPQTLGPSAPPRRFRLFAGAADEPRARRAGDVFLLVVSMGLLLSVSALADPPSRLEGAVASLFAALPSIFDSLWVALTKIPWVAAVVLGLAVVARRRWALARDLFVSAGVATLLLWVAGRVAPSAPRLLDYPVIPIAISGALLVTAHPHLTKGLRRPVSISIVGALIGAAASLQLSPSRALVATLAAVASGALVHLAFGSARGRPLLEDVSRAMAELGIEATDFGVADRQDAGEFKVEAFDANGAPLLIKVYGRDAHDTQLLRTAWRAAWYRGRSGESSLGRLGQVEHEGLVTLLAAQAGIPTFGVVTAGASRSGDAYLVMRPSGRPVPAQGWEPDLMGAMWATLERLHQAGLTHGQVDSQGMFLSDSGDIGLANLRAGSVTVDANRVGSDRAQLFVDTVLHGSEDAAIASAVEALGREGFSAILPLVQEPVLAPGQRRLSREVGLDTDELRQRAAEAIGETSPELQQLRRVTWGGVLQTALLLFAFFVLARVAGGVDFGALLEALATVNWWLVGAGFVVAQIPAFGRTASSLGASPLRVPLGPLYALQLATAYVSLVIPSAAGRIALNVRFFQRQGLARPTALTVGALDGFGGFVTQVIVLTALLTLTPATLDLDIELSLSSGVGRLLLWILGIALAAGAVIFAIPGFRDRITGQLRSMWAGASQALQGLGSRRRLAMLLGGNFSVDFFLAIALGMFVLSFGYSLGIGELLVIVISVSLLAGLMPVPGGIGVTEGALVFGLVSAGLPEEIALAVVILHRLASFYVPPIWGFFALRWLGRNNYI